MAKYQQVPPQVGRFLQKYLGFIPTCRSAPMMTVDWTQAFKGRPVVLSEHNIAVRDEYNNLAGVHDGYVYFESEADAVHYHLMASR